MSGATRVWWVAAALGNVTGLASAASWHRVVTARDVLGVAILEVIALTVVFTVTAARGRGRGRDG